MLKLHFGHTDDTLFYPGSYFNVTYNPDDKWFDDPFIKEIVYGIDCVTIESDFNMFSERFGMPCNYTTISTGSKNTILAYKTDFVINGDNLGDNCVPYILKIADSKDLIITLEHIIQFPEKFECIILNDNTRISNYDDYVKSYLKHKSSWCKWC